MKINIKSLLRYISILFVFFIGSGFVFATYEDEFPCPNGDYDYVPTGPIDPNGPKTYCEAHPSSCGDEGEEPPPCYPHNCTVPECPTNTTKYDTGYSTGYSGSCDRGCGQHSSNMCYEIPTTCDPVYQDCEDQYKNSLQSEVEFHPLQVSNSMGYSSTTYSGMEINNPVEVEAKYWSTVDTSKLEAIYFWMAKEGTNPPGSGTTSATVPTGNVFDCYCTSSGSCICSSRWAPSTPVASTSDGIKWIYGSTVTSGRSVSDGSWGFMVRKVNGKWSEVYVPLITEGRSYWAKITSVGTTFSIHSPSGKPMVNISDLKVTESSKVVADFKITFLNETSGVSDYQKVSEGIYNAYTMANDVFGFTPWDNYQDQGVRDRLDYEPNEIRMTNLWSKGAQQWGVDLTRPSVSKLETIVRSSTGLSVDWEGQDMQSDISYSVGNGFRLKDGLVKNSPVIYPAGSGRSITLNFQTSSDVVGKIGGGNIIWEKANVKSGSEMIDLVDNRGGYVDFYVTVYDRGGNYTTQNTRFKIGEWIETMGGFFYSKEGAYLDTRKIAPGLWSQRQLFDSYGIKEDKVDLGTELLAGNVENPTSISIVNYLASNGSYRAINYAGFRKSDAYYGYMGKLQELEDSSRLVKVSLPTLSGNLSDNCADRQKCKSGIVINTVEGNLTVNSNFRCDTKSVMLVSGNIYVNPDVTNVDNKSACVFIAGENIYIKEGTRKSGSSIGFDILNGYFLADSTIRIEKENKSSDERTDGLFIEGGLVSFGTDPNENASIMLKRELHLADRLPYPVLNIVHQAKYGKLMEEVFGGERLVFKSEIGFKEY